MTEPGERPRTPRIRREVLQLTADTGLTAGQLSAHLRRALRGEGPVLALGGLPDPAPDTIDDSDPDDPLAATVLTSGSTGRPRVVLLPAAALLAAANAGHDRLGGPGTWLLALPVHHVAGLMVLVRSLVAGRDPVPMAAGPFTATGFVAACAQLPAQGTCYTALVPTQLVRLVSDPAAVRCLRRFRAVLVGGAAAPAQLLRRARELAVPIVTTYGSSETSGGCVYDGVPLDGVQIRLAHDGCIQVAGPVLARGYLGEPLHPGDDGQRWLHTQDLGVWQQGRLQVLGRRDDVIVTGGAKVSPVLVEAALAELPEVAEAVVVGIPDPEWGHRVEAVLTLRENAPAPDLTRVREWVGQRLGAPARPRRIEVLQRLPLIGPGKPDRAAVLDLLTGPPTAPPPEPAAPRRGPDAHPDAPRSQET